jgi:hypothetical protein
VDSCCPRDPRNAPRHKEASHREGTPRETRRQDAPPQLDPTSTSGAGAGSSRPKRTTSAPRMDVEVRIRAVVLRDLVRLMIVAVEATPDPDSAQSPSIFPKDSATPPEARSSLKQSPLLNGDGPTEDHGIRCHMRGDGIGKAFAPVHQQRINSPREHGRQPPLMDEAECDRRSDE